MGRDKHGSRREDITWEHMGRVKGWEYRAIRGSVKGRE